ncbi:MULTISPECIES: hypothetical protein [unclassified Nocardiopsis]|uniref:hypothetical protein n=1 Tax=Nocardiopsis TaxID=2013 RepID=UPI00387B5D33
MLEILGEVLAECALDMSEHGAGDHNCAAQFLRRNAPPVDVRMSDFLTGVHKEHF